LRHHNVGINIPEDLDFHDYIMAYPGWDSKSMALVNITSNNHKTGSVYGGSTNTQGTTTVTKSALQFTLGEKLENWYLIDKS
jgi:hypothetical protein